MNISLYPVNRKNTRDGFKDVGRRKKQGYNEAIPCRINYLSILGGIWKLFSAIFSQSWRISCERGIIKTQSRVLAFIVCFVIGVFFGWYPARKLSNLNR